MHTRHRELFCTAVAPSEGVPGVVCYYMNVYGVALWQILPLAWPMWCRTYEVWKFIVGQERSLSPAQFRSTIMRMRSLYCAQKSMRTMPSGPSKAAIPCSTAGFTRSANSPGELFGTAWHEA